jgi:hypothetical protein
LTEPWAWTTEGGDRMQAAAGDWRVTSPEGRQWSVAPDVFAATYAPLGQGRFRRTGTVAARPAQRDQQVTTLEGKSHAGGNDWLVVGPAGEMWVVPDDQFRTTYVPTSTGPGS